jgi:hypothetical protein
MLRSASFVEMFMGVFTWCILKPSCICIHCTLILLLSVTTSYNFKTESAVILLGYGCLGYDEKKILWVITNVPEESAV